MNYLLTLIIQIAAILIVSRLMGLLFRRFKQPQVIGEMTAGILLGPSLLGWLAPSVSLFIFPPESLSYLNILSQLGLLLFMFIVGLELDPELLKGRGHAAVLISHLSIILPFIFGTTLALYLYPLLSDNSVTFIAFALFLGASMSITAFPVLARILIERNLIKTKLGAIAIACAAVDDITAWSILAVVVTIIRAGSVGIPIWLTIYGSIVFILLMLFVIRPSLKKLEIFYKNKGNKLTHDILGLVILAMFASAWITEWLGIHALFGAFFMGAVMPRNKEFLKDIIKRLNDVTLILLLPIFFALTGLKTSIGLISGTEMWFYFFLIIAAAIGGKLGGSFLAARISSLEWREALGIGVLMNTRGLMELIILSIGLELGVISEALFAMMVMMALLTTFMTTPLLEWVYPKEFLRKELEDARRGKLEYRILIPVSLPSSGPGLLNIASAIAPKDESTIYALHLTRQYGILFPHNDENANYIDTENPLAPVLKYAKAHSLNIHPLSFVTQNAADDIRQVTKIKNINLILMGWHKPIMSEGILSGTVSEVIKYAKADVCIYLQRIFTQYKNILVPFTEGIHDKGAVEIAQRVASYCNAHLTILFIVNTTSEFNDTANSKDDLAQKMGIKNFSDDNVELLVIENPNHLNALLEIATQNFDLIVLGLSEKWGFEPSLFSKKHELLAFKCPASLLILRKYEFTS